VTDAELHKTVSDTMGDIAPAHLQTLPPCKAIALHEKLGVDIPEADYPQLVTLDGAVAYLRKTGGI
jgi:hypothetical protein